MDRSVRCSFNFALSVSWIDCLVFAILGCGVRAVLFVPIILYVLLIEASLESGLKNPQSATESGGRVWRISEHFIETNLRNDWRDNRLGPHWLVGLELSPSTSGPHRLAKWSPPSENDVAGYVGETATRWLFLAIFFAFVIWPAIRMVGVASGQGRKMDRRASRA